jgi:hypothetical protein
MVYDLDSERHLECSQAFELGEGDEGLSHGGRALRVRSLDVLDSALGLARGEHVPSKPIEFVHDEGRKPQDMVGTTDGRPVLVSQRLIDVLRDHGFSGWRTFPVRLTLEDGTELRGYHGFSVTGRCGPIDDSLSDQVMLAPPVPGGEPAPGLRGLCFTPGSWDGSDIFTSAAGGAMIFVVERVKDALERAGITNVAFQRLSEIERIWRADGTLME